MTSMCVLHVSDLHYEPTREYDRNIVIQALLADIRARRSEGIEFDFVIFSGDLVNVGANADAFTKSIDAFIAPLLAAAGLKRDRLIICPGNHDVSQDGVVDKRDGFSYIEKGLREELASVASINAFIDHALGDGASRSSTKAALERMANYEAFHASLGLGAHISANIFYKTRMLQINGYKVGIAAMNSAWRATGTKDDKNNLIVGERAVDLAIRDLADADLRICVQHHPMDWLLECDAIAVENRVYEAFDIVCFGHTHRSYPKQQLSPLGTNIVSQSGTVYENRKWFNGYQIVEWTDVDRKVIFHCRSYQDARRVFAPAENVAAGGVVQFELKPKPGKSVLTEVELFLRQVRTSIRQAANDHISFARNEGAKSIDFSEAFVCQPLTNRPDVKSTIEETEDLKQTPKQLSADDLLRSTQTVALIGHSESGKTTLLHHLAIRVSEGVCDCPRVPAIVHMPFAEKTTYEKALRAYFDTADIKPGSVSTAVSKATWLVFLDDFDTQNAEHLAILDTVQHNYPNHRLMIACTDQGTSALPKSLKNGLMTVDIGYLPRRSIRQLSRVRFGGQLETGMDDPAYSLVMKNLEESALPRTGYTVALLLWAAEQERLGQTLNEAVLLENLISFLLGKTDFKAAIRNQFDPRAQELLLRAIAVKLRGSGGWIEANDLLGFIIDYFKSRGLKHAANEVLEQFLACRLLVQRGEYIAFRYMCYQQYFVAADLRNAPDKLKALVAPGNEEQVLSLGRELDLWSSLSREMQGVDEVVLRLLEKHGLSVTGSLQDLEGQKFVGTELKFKSKRIAELLDNPLTKDQIDEIWDAFDRAKGRSDRHGSPSMGEQQRLPDQGSERGDDAVQFAAEVISFADQRAALSLLMRLLRNCDHEKVEKKRDVALKALKLWNSHTANLLEMLSKHLRDAAPRIAQREGAVLTTDDLEKIENIFKLAIATADADSFSQLLNGEPVRPILEGFAKDFDQTEGVRFLAAFSFAHTWDARGVALVEEVLKGIKSRVLLHAALHKMLHDYQFQEFQTASASRFRELIASTAAHLYGRTGPAKGDLIASLLASDKAAEEGE